MPFYKKCFCGEIITSESRSRFPLKCPKCERDLSRFNATEGLPPEIAKNDYVKEICQLPEPQKKRAWKLISVDDDSLVIPLSDNKGIIGRASEGMELLDWFPSVSRKHCRYEIDQNGELYISDISQFGTYINDIRMAKEHTIHVPNGSVIKLCNVAFVVAEVE